MVRGIIKHHPAAAAAAATAVHLLRAFRLHATTAPVGGFPNVFRLAVTAKSEPCLHTPRGHVLTSPTRRGLT